MAQKPLKEAQKNATKLVVATQSGVDTAAALKRLGMIGEEVDRLLKKGLCNMKELESAINITKEIVITEAILSGPPDDESD